MGWTTHRTRHLPGVLALIGMVFYAILLPWHTVSQATTQSLQVKPPCHEIGSVSSKRSQTPKPQTNCPICKGFAAFQLATTASFAILGFAATTVETEAAISTDCLESSGCEKPRSRAPPTFSL
jgi:hypothetical protein